MPGKGKPPAERSIDCLQRLGLIGMTLHPCSSIRSRRSSTCWPGASPRTPLGERIYLDVGDEQSHVVEVDATGWLLTKDSPVRFRGTVGMQAMPLPQRGGSIAQLRALVNLDDDAFVLYVSWLLDALCPGRPHPVLFLGGEEGSAKSTAARIARSLVDPHAVPLRNLPTTLDDLFVGANGAHAMAFDNVSIISAAISDGLCQIASGSGYGTRRRFTDTEQVLIGGSRPIIINGLLNAINRSDLADRTIAISMSRVGSEQRCSEAEIWSRFELHRAQIFGALLDCVACGLRKLPETRLERLPRMADFGGASRLQHSNRGSS
jgi:hypothetical protein